MLDYGILSPFFVLGRGGVSQPRMQEVLLSGEASQDFDSTGNRRRRLDGNRNTKGIPNRMDTGWNWRNRVVWEGELCLDGTFYRFLCTHTHKTITFK